MGVLKAIVISQSIINHKYWICPHVKANAGWHGNYVQSISFKMSYEDRSRAKDITTWAP